MERRLMTDVEIAEALKDLTGWSAVNDSLVKRYEFPNFALALEFVNKAAALAEAADHHPDIKLGWGYADFAITTHDCGGITDADFALAKGINNVAL